MLTVYYSETDSVSECTNKTVSQLLQFYVDYQQQGWQAQLSQVQFCLMNSVNTSTGYSLFQLQYRCLLCTVLPLTQVAEPLQADSLEAHTVDFLAYIHQDIVEAQDSLLVAKTCQAHYANQDQTVEDCFAVGDQVILSTHNYCQDYLVQTLGQAAKFILYYNRLYFVIVANSDKSEYTLELLNSNQTFLGFYTSQLKYYVLNNNNLFLQHTLVRLSPVDREVEVYKVLQIVDRRH